MSASQFTLYSSLDSGAPVCNGLTGSFLTLLNKCLVSGYGSKAGAGWTKPFADSGSYGCFQNSSGSAMTVFINDTHGLTTTEAVAAGWEQLTSLTTAVGTGIGQFPLPSQLLSGNVVFRKSGTADGTTRAWKIYADAYTFYFFVQSEAGTPLTYFSFWFGDFFSFLGTSDLNRCMIQGATQEASNTAANHAWDRMNYCITSTPVLGFYVCRSWNGNPGSLIMKRLGDSSISNLATDPPITDGNVVCPNPTDQSVLLCPLRVVDDPFVYVRGRLRGLYHVGHPTTSFYDGQIIAGINEYAGKTFQIITPGPNGGYLAIETSATVETN